MNQKVVARKYRKLQCTRRHKWTTQRDKNRAPLLLIVVTFLSPYLVWVAAAPTGNLEVPSSPAMRALFASFST